jgi:glycosyltransferase involved in cell wall biosynthesis
MIGYVGGLHRHLDLRLAVELAQARPTWSWVYVGPTETPIPELAAQPNVHILGRVPHPSVASYIGEFDVCTVPYKLGPETDTVFPTKLVEYLAMGKPVVSTMLPEVREFNAQHGVLTAAPSRPDAFLGVIEEALALAEDGQPVARRRAAASRDWESHLEGMSDLIEARART